MTLSFNAEQQAGVNAIDGDFVMIAGPGSGKTRVLVERYLKMVMNHGISQRDVLNLTFTSSAATEMAERVGLMDADKVFRTFHSFCLDLLKKERQHLPFKTVDTVIPVRGEQGALLIDLVKVYKSITSTRALHQKIGEWKAENISVQQALDESYDARTMDYFYALAYRDYETRCRKEGWLDFDSLVKETVALLETNDGVRERHRRKYIAVDECQDTDTTQFRLLQLIYGGNIFVVGDENQLIYEWRSAQSGNLSNFSKSYPNAKTLYLGTNYRSTSKLVDYFKSILPVDNGLASHMTSARWEGYRPRFIRYSHEDEEANETIIEIMDRDIISSSVILARTNRQLQLIQRRAMSQNIRTEIVGKKNVWQENEVKRLLELVKEHTHDSRPAAIVMAELIHAHHLIERFSFNSNPSEKSPAENLNDIVRMAARKSKLTGQPQNIPQFLEWMRKITHMRKMKDSPILMLSTVHQAKGKEWKQVFVVGCDQGTMPHKEGELNEESRIFFVACSRAADELIISFSKNHSQFLNDVVEEIEIFGEEDDENGEL